MKKSVLLISAIAALTMTFVSCNKQSEDETKDDTTEITKPSDAEDKDTDEKSDADDSKNTSSGYEIPAGAITVANFTDCVADADIPESITLPGWGYDGYIMGDETYGQTLNLECKKAGDYPTLTYTFATPTDLSAYTLVLVMKGDSSVYDGDANGNMKVVIFSSEGSETQAASEENYTLPDDADNYKPYYADVSSFWASWNDALEDVGAAADITAVKSMQIKFQKANYDMQIAAIYFVPTVQ